MCNEIWFISMRWTMVTEMNELDYGLKEMNEMDYILKEINEMDYGWNKVRCNVMIEVHEVMLINYVMMCDSSQ